MPRWKRSNSPMGLTRLREHSFSVTCDYESSYWLAGMNEMVDRVARAMHGADGIKSFASFDDESAGNQWDYRSMARAAIAAMREPTEAMMQAAHIIIGDLADQKRSWQYAIDAALKE